MRLLILPVCANAGRALAVGCMLAATATPALANVMWPEMFLAKRIGEWWVVAAGFVVELLFVWWFFQLPLWKAALADAAANAASAAFGFVALPSLGFMREFLLMPFGMLTFRSPNMLTALILVLAVNVLIEGLIYRLAFRVPPSRRNLIWLTVANAISVLFMYESFSIVPMRRA